MQPSPVIFNRHHVRQHKQRAQAHFSEYDFLLREAADRLADRLEDMTRHFPLALGLGGHNRIGDIIGSRGGIETLVQTGWVAGGDVQVICDEEFLPFAGNHFDLAFSPLALHWVNDLPGVLIQLRHVLKPDGLLLATVFGGQTLQELRHVLTDAALEMSGGVSPSVSPFMDVRDAGALLQRAGFSLPVIDSEILTVTYDNLFMLMHDLRGMGETNALLHKRASFSRRDVFMRAAELYSQRYGNSEGRITATFELVTMTAWTPHNSQQQPAKRGSGTVSLRDMLQ